MFMIRDLMVVLQKFGLVEIFKQGPFGQYLDLKQPLIVYGHLIHNLLKREIIHPNGQRQDEMWFGLGKSKARFGQEEFCLCSGLKMGQLPEGFANNNEVEEDSMLRRIFKGKRPTAEVLYATLKRMSTEESEDVYKMLNIYMVSQFFGMDDGRTTAISGWLFSLVENEDEFKKFLWGSYIFNFTLFFLKDVLNKRLPKLRGEEEKEDKNGKMKKNKKTVEEEEVLEEDKKKKNKNKNKNKKSVEEQEVKGKGKGKGKGKLQGEEEKKEKKSKYYTYNLSGFPLALQVWAMERVISLENLVGKRVATGYPRFSRWEFNAKTALFEWEVETFEKGTDYFKSPNIEYVCGPLIDKKREKLALPRSEEEEDLGSDHEGDDNQTGNDNDGIDCSVQKEEIGGSVGRTRSIFSNEYSPTSKKRLFSDRNPKVPSTIPELYDAMLESEQRIIAFCREEFSKIRKEMKNGAEQADDVVDDKGAGNNVTVGDDKGAGNNVKDVEELNSVGEVGEVGELGKDVQQDAVAEVGKGGEEDDAFGDVDAAFQGGKGEEKDDDVGDVDAAFHGGKGEEKDDDVGDVDATFQGGKGEEKDDEVSDLNAAFEGCKGDEQEDDAGEIGKGSKEGVGSDCVVVRDAAFEGGKGDEQEDDVGEIGKGSKEVVGSDCVVVADAAFDGGKGDDQEDAAVGEIGTGCDQGVGSDGVVVGDATVEGDMVEELVKKSIIDLDEYPSPSVCFIAQNNPSSVVALDGADPDVKYRDIDKQRGRKRSRNRYQEPENGYHEPRNGTMRLGMEIMSLGMDAMSLGEISAGNFCIYAFDLYKPDYPEFVPLNYQPSPDIPRHVTGHDLLYPQPWWEMDSHAGYYEEMKMDPHAIPFTVQSMRSELIPQQDDGYSCGVFLMKYAELILAGVKTPWNSVFGQKDIKGIRKAIAIDIYTNGQPCNSP
ncbi:hypothetical protein Dsin_016969 [Dipteronia sinensis]|uniref:Ubiquitin-like protease family profile domain-containing protein n=1 Tax=Dipteronia sinensis TaxID=43782 RepID=A0AAE0AF18_9ROSI|nr:hypothetical protein Dsin_016969 [Dipteronia sinensis]